MPLNESFLMDFPFEESEQTYAARDTILYALGVGLGTDPLDERQLCYVYERMLKALPSMVNVLCSPGPWVTNPQTGISWAQMLHGEQQIEFHRQIPAEGSVRARTVVEQVVDKGVGKGALVYTRRDVKDSASGELLATVRQALVCRADGGFASMPGQARPVHALPEREPDATCDLTTLPQAALIYRLSGDLNPLHIDPIVAASAGFPRPILHGLCTFGVVTHAILREALGYDSTRLRSLHMRFSAPVFPGETLRTEIWKEGYGVIGFRCRVLERDLIVINNGLARVGY